MVPPYNRQLFPHESFPPWRALLRVFGFIAELRRRCPPGTSLKRLETPLVHASERIVAVAGGELSPERWHRRVRVAIAKLERAKSSIVDYVVSDTLSLSEALALGDGIDDTIALLVETVARVPFPDEVRTRLPELCVPARLAH